jgi:hypothetical protein
MEHQKMLPIIIIIIIIQPFRWITLHYTPTRIDIAGSRQKVNKTDISFFNLAAAKH